MPWKILALSALFGFCSVTSLMSQSENLVYPYNPDFENDGHVGIEDLLELLSVLGDSFQPDELFFDDLSISDWFQLVNSELGQTTNMVDSLGAEVWGLQSLLNEINDSGLINVPVGTMILSQPDGFSSFQPVTHSSYDGSYIVPLGQNLYITSVYSSVPNNDLKVDSLVVFRGAGLGANYTSAPQGQIHLPILAGENQTVMFSNAGSAGWFSGFVVNGQVEPVTVGISANGAYPETAYIVPENKLFVLLNVHTFQSGDILFCNGKQAMRGAINNFDPSVTAGCSPVCAAKTLLNPIILQQGDSLSTWIASAVLNGYLVDADVFETMTVQSPVSPEEVGVDSLNVFFDIDHLEMELDSISAFVWVDGDDFNTLGCSSCHYSLYLPNSGGELLDGFELTLYYAGEGQNSPYIKVYSNSGSTLMDSWGPSVGRFIWIDGNWLSF